MKNFRVPLAEPTYAMLRAASERTKTPATTLVREAIDQWLAEESRRVLHDEIAAFAEEFAGTELDRDPDLEAAGVKHLMKTNEDW